MTRIVVFDLGGVLVRVAHTWEEVHALAGFPPETFPRTPDFRAAIARVVPASDKGEIEHEDVVRAIAQASDGAYTVADAERLHAAISREEMQDVATVFDALEAAGVETGLLSNTCRPHWERLANLAGGPPEYPNLLRARHRHASYLLRLAKPDPRIYRAFESASGFAPSDILFFDDREENVTGARAVGWSAERIDPLTPTVPQIFAVLRQHALA